MISKIIAVIEHDNFIIGYAILNIEQYFAIIRYINVHEKLMSHEELNNIYIKLVAFESLFSSFYLIHIVLL